MSGHRITPLHRLQPLQDTLGAHIGEFTDPLGEAGARLARSGLELSENAGRSASALIRARPLSTVLAVAIISFALGTLARN